MADLVPGSAVWAWLPPAPERKDVCMWLPAVVVSATASNGAADTVQVKITGNSPAAGQICDVPVARTFLQNQDGDVNGAEDMTTLTHLNEPGVLHNLDFRYGKDAIYTNVGSIVIAINPFKRIPALIAPTVMQAYQQQAPGLSKLAPHVYHTAVSAYRQMLRDKAGQAILITGESGAGKTETCKLIMRCLAHMGATHGSSGQDHSSNGHASMNQPGNVEQMVLESNPLLEAFGNAKTSRNDNSSRFGKYVEIQFTDAGVLLGAAIKTYLLERSRVVHVVPGERSFHAFYQVCAGASPEQRKEWHLGTSKDYSVLCQSDCHQLNGMDDAEEFKATCHAMGIVNMPPERQHEVWTTAVAILHLGNVRFVEPAAGVAPPPELSGLIQPCKVQDAPGVADSRSWQSLVWAAELFKINADQLLAAISTRTRQTPVGAIVSPLTPSEADEARNTLCKIVYARMFDWIVACINASLARHRTSVANGHSNGNDVHASTNGHAANGLANGMPGSPGFARSTTNPDLTTSTPPRNAHSHHASGGLPQGSPGGAGADEDSGFTIGLLDIYGFESFEVNDLEQLCINLTNEKLQQHFNQFVFKWEQAEYTREGVDWRYIEFVDNQEVLDLIEGKLGLMDILDEQCRFPKASAEDLAVKYGSTPAIAQSKRFEKTKRERTGFSINHYAGPVKYQTNNFLEKNKDFVVAEHAALMASSELTLVSSLFLEPGQVGAAGTPPRQSGSGATDGAVKSTFKFDSVASQFKRQLADLMAALHKAQPHYVRCIKPNPGNKAGVFDQLYVLNQLQCGGVMEAVRISCAGFSYKRPYAAFLDYFWLLCPSALHGLRKYDTMRHAHSEMDLMKVTAPHMPASQLLQQPNMPIEALKAASEQILKLAGVTGYHMGVTKLFLKSAQAAVLDKQRSMVVVKAVTRIQAHWRGYRARTAYEELRAATIQLQALVRAFLARQLAERLRRERAATVLQTAWRGYAARTALQRSREAATLLQCLWRARVVRLSMEEKFRERAAMFLQAAWRARIVWHARQHEIRYHQAAVQVQSCWRGRQARQYYQTVLPKHKSAIQIQRAWRSSRSGVRIREKLRNIVLLAVELNKAAVVIQTAWRAKAARMELDKIKRLQVRQRFTNQFSMFQQATTNPASSTLIHKPKEQKELLPYQIKQLEAAKNPPVIQPRAAPAYDPDRAVPMPTPPVDHLKDLEDFKVSPVLNLWKQMETEAAQHKQTLSQARDKSNVVRWQPKTPGTSTTPGTSNQ